MIIRFAYVDLQGDRSSRRVWPVQSVCTEDHVYLDAFCLDARAVRRFRVDRMSNVSADGEPIDEPEPFFAALAIARAAATAYSERGGERSHVTVDGLSRDVGDPEVIQTLERLRGEAARSGDAAPEATAAYAAERVFSGDF
jgi:hypothetical protein